MKTITILITLLLAVTSGYGQVRVVTSTSDLAFFAERIGGDMISVESIARPTADIHFVEVRPSYMVKVRKADVAFKVGLELDQWMDEIIRGSRNSHLVVVDCSKHVEPLEVPDFKVDARYGDLHRFGNPHYWLGPFNVKPITDAIVEGLSQADPQNAAGYRANQELYLEQLESELQQLTALTERLAGKEIITYHNSWPYFNQFVGLIAAGFVEPYPGVPPSATHVKKLTSLIRERGIRIIGVEPYFDHRVPDKLAAETGAVVVTLYPSVGGRSTPETYLEWLKGNLEALAEALP